MFLITFAVEQFHVGAMILDMQTVHRQSRMDMTLRYFCLNEQEQAAMTCPLHSVSDGLLGV